MAVERQPTSDLELALSTAMMVLVFISLPLRLYARSQTKAGIWSLEDILIFVAAATFYAEQGAYLQAVLGEGSSGGSDLTMMTPSQMNHYFKHLFIQEHLFALCITLVKLSILVFYRRLFPIYGFSRRTWVAIALSIIWYIVVTFLLIFQCNPIHAFWTMAVKVTRAKCMSPGKLLFGVGISNIAVDLIILALPVYMIQQLPVKTAQKCSIIGIFLLGGFVCIASAIRAYYCWKADAGLTRATTYSLNWATIELSSALICASLPTYAPIFYKLRVKLCFSQARSSPSCGGGSKVTGGRALSSNGEYDQLSEHPSASSKSVVTSRLSAHQNNLYQMGHIHVERSVEVV